MDLQFNLFPDQFPICTVAEFTWRMTKNVHMQFQSSINQQQMNQIGNQDRQISVLCTHNSIEIYNVLRHLIEYIIEWNTYWNVTHFETWFGFLWTHFIVLCLKKLFFLFRWRNKELCSHFRRPRTSRCDFFTNAAINTTREDVLLDARPCVALTRVFSIHHF